MIDHNAVDREKFCEDDTYASVEFKIGKIEEQRVVTIKLGMNGNGDEAGDAFVEWMHHGMISTMLSIVEECGGNDMVLVDVIKSWLEELGDIAKDFNKKYLHEDEDENEDKEVDKEQTVKMFKKCFKNK